MSRFEDEQFCKMVQEVLSEEESDFSDSDYNPDCSDSDGSENSFEHSVETKTKRVPKEHLNLCQNAVPSTSRDSVDETIDLVINTLFADETHEYNEEISKSVNSSISWGPVTGNNLKVFQFDSGNSGITSNLYENYYDKEPSDFYKIMINEDILNLIVEETNRYASQCVLKNRYKRSRVTAWRNTDREEMEIF